MSGAAGHLMHLHDDWDLTFRELKSILRAAAAGKLQDVTEKLDGMNLVFTWDGDLKVARSGRDISTGGMNATALAKKFCGRGDVEEAFNEAFRVLREAVSCLPEKAKARIFVKGTAWYSIEVIYAKSPNVIHYDENSVVFHRSPVFHVGPDGKSTKVNERAGIDLLVRYVERMQRNVTGDWHVRGPAEVHLQKMSSPLVLKRAIEDLDNARRGLSDSSTIADYLKRAILPRALELTPDRHVASMIADRVVSVRGGPSLTQIKQLVPVALYPMIRDFVEREDQVCAEAIGPIELAIHNFAVGRLRKLSSALVKRPRDEIVRLRFEFASALGTILASGDARAKELLNLQMRKLGLFERIVTPMEGIVFVHGERTYKFTGSFAPVNQVLGLLKYGRSGTKVGEQKLLSSTSL